MNDWRREMRAIDCPCGHQVQANDDEELFRLCREHIAEHHPEPQRTNAQIRERVGADAYEAGVVV
jgi:predicted small metal-binding protein